MFDSIFVPNMGQRNPNDYPPDWTLLKRMMWVRMSQIPAGPTYETVGPDSIVSFNAIHAAALKSLLVTLTPQQNLNGYSNPWPAGGGANILPTASASNAHDLNGVTATFSEDGTITLNGTQAESAGFIDVQFPTPIEVGTYSMSWFNSAAQSGIEFSLRDSSKNSSVGMWNTPASGANKTKTDTLSAKAYWWRLQINNGASFSNFKITPMAVVGSTAPTSYASYTNICPISGHTSAVVTRTGVNRLDMEHAQTGFARRCTVSISGDTLTATCNESGQVWVGSSGEVGTAGTPAFLFPACYGETVSVDIDSNVMQVVFYEFNNSGVLTVGNATPEGGSIDTNHFEHIIVSNDTTHVGIRIFFSNSGAVGNKWNIRINAHSGTETLDFVPYIATTYPISFPDGAGTVYGGTLDVVTGVLTVTDVRIDMGSRSYGKNNDYGFYSSLSDVKTFSADSLSTIKCEIYKTAKVADIVAKRETKAIGVANTMLYVADLDYATASDFKTAMNGVYLVYPLATPQTYQLTPKEVTALVGTNNVWADAGTQVTVEYRSN